MEPRTAFPPLAPKPAPEEKPYHGQFPPMQTLDEKPSDTVNHPAHYTSGKYETIEVIEDWGLGFCLGNAVKYISRAGKKYPSKTAEDLKKAIWYITREIERIEGKERE